jgi:hypothetical protein
MSLNIPLMDELYCLKEYDISYVSCASIAESLNSSNHNSLDHDCVGPAQSLNALFDSPNI